ncbi:MAG: insulinase family protein [Candidatus Riflebacteria bacterium]|nr:insulinase family protein [Candidatus Riflebacteria bacterium]
MGRYDLDHAIDRLGRLALHETTLATRRAPLTWADRTFRSIEVTGLGPPSMIYGGFGAKSKYRNDHVIAEFLFDYLIKDPGGVLYRWLRGNKGWTYRLDSHFDVDREHYFWCVMLPLPSVDQAPEVRREITQRLEKAVIDEKSLRIAKETAIAREPFRCQTVPSIADHALDQIELFDEVLSEPQWLEVVRSISPAGAFWVLHRFFLGNVGELVAVPPRG